MNRKQLELYIHIPFCVRKCQYCDFLSFPADEATRKAYVDALVREIAYYGPKCRDYVVTTVYIGGGTPSWLAAESIEAVMAAVHREFTFAPKTEISIECNPGTVTERKLVAYRRAGINRISIGLQSANDTELALLGRIHTWQQFVENYELARKTGFANINVDLMNSLPGQTLESFQQTLQRILQLGPEHISAYSLIVEEGTPFYEAYREDVRLQEAGEQTRWLPTEEQVNAMTRMTEQMLAEGGYRHYEISNFARPGYECRHNIGYWERENYLGFGIGAASLIENVRYSNTGDISFYLENTKKICENSAVSEKDSETCESAVSENKRKISENTVVSEKDSEMSKNAAVPEKERENGNIIRNMATNLHISVERISRKAQMEEFMFLGLRKTDGIFMDAFFQTFGVSAEAVYEAVISGLVENGLLAKKDGRMFLTERGREVSNYVLAQFLLE